MGKQPTYIFILIFCFLLSVNCSFSQNGKQKELEARRVELRREINKINALVSSNKSKEKSQVSLIEDLNYKVKVRRDLIKVTNQQANLVTRRINHNQKQITALRTELKALKINYAGMIEKSYKNKNKQSRIMFLLSSNNFKQAYKRLQYIKQYAEYQRQQGQSIKIKTKELQESNSLLLVQKVKKNKLIQENIVAQGALEKELIQHNTIMTAIKKDLKNYVSQIRSRQRETSSINREIDKIIRDAIVKSNTKTGTVKTKSTVFAMAPEDKALAKSFLGSKGKLPWPVIEGVVKVRYGKQPSPIDRSIIINSNGVRISTNKGTKVRAVYTGEVFRIFRPKRSNPTVLIKHGNYITAYKNLGKLYVQEGDMVKTKQEIGEVFTHPRTGESTLRFSIYKDDETQNPASWIYKM